LLLLLLLLLLPIIMLLLLLTMMMMMMMMLLLLHLLPTSRSGRENQLSLRLQRRRDAAAAPCHPRTRQAHSKSPLHIDLMSFAGGVADVTLRALRAAGVQACRRLILQPVICNECAVVRWPAGAEARASGPCRRRHERGVRRPQVLQRTAAFGVRISM
jgi:hypothetical protein